VLRIVCVTLLFTGDSDVQENHELRESKPRGRRGTRDAVSRDVLIKNRAAGSGTAGDARLPVPGEA
jgi:hypothetical protein